MTGWTLKAAKVVAMAGLIAGVGVSAALADPGNGNSSANSAANAADPSSDKPGNDSGKGTGKNDK